MWKDIFEEYNFYSLTTIILDWWFVSIAKNTDIES